MTAAWGSSVTTKPPSASSRISWSPGARHVRSAHSWRSQGPFERYRDADAAIEHFSNISHLMEPILATASVTGEVLGTPNAKMKELLRKGGPKLFTPWLALQDQELVEGE